MVDESDLLALLDDDTAAALTTCNCKEKCAAGQVNTDCPVCKTCLLYTSTIDQAKAIKSIKSKITDLDKMKIEEQKKAVRAGYDMDISATRS